MKFDDIPDGPLSNDQEENLRIENELLRLQLKAELGVEPYKTNVVGPQIENEFLKHILNFEHNHANSKQIKVYDLLGRPDFKRSDEVSDDLIDGALAQITQLLSKKNIEVYFGEGYDNRLKYHFITEELFEHEMDDLVLQGMVTHFDYEEFHPNHKKDIERRALSFLSGWFSQTLNEKSWELAESFVLPGRRILTKSQVLTQIRNIFSAYPSFKDQDYFIAEVSFELHDHTGLGHAEGIVKYNAVLENGETAAFNGPFKLYLSLENGWWSIFHIILPGFKY